MLSLKAGGWEQGISSGLYKHELQLLSQKNTRKVEPKQLPKSTKTEKSTCLLNSFLDTTACTQEILLKNVFWSHIIVDPFPAYCLAKEWKLTEMLYIIQAEHCLLDFPHQLPFTFVPPYFFCSSWPCFFCLFCCCCCCCFCWAFTTGRFFWKTFKILGLFWKRCNDYLQIVQFQGFNVRTIQNNSNFFTKFFSTNAINSQSKIKKTTNCLSSFNCKPSIYWNTWKCYK